MPTSTIWYPPLGDDDRFRTDLRPRFARGRRRRDHRQWHRGDRDVRADDGPDDRADRPSALFEKGAAERVIAAVMTKDRAHMHLDTVFTLLDRDKATAYAKVVDGHPGDQPPPADRSPARSTSARRRTSCPPSRDALGVTEAARGRDRRRRSTSRNASSGTMATTSSPSSPALSSPTSATRSQSRRCGRRGSRSSRSRASSLARAAAGVIA